MALRPDASYLKPGREFTVIGWGDTDIGDGRVYPTQLQTVQVPFVAFDECQQAYGGELSRGKVICAGREGIDSCQGTPAGRCCCACVRAGPSSASSAGARAARWPAIRGFMPESPKTRRRFH